MNRREWVAISVLFLFAMLGSVVEFFGESSQIASWGQALTSLYYLPIVVAALKSGSRTALGVAIAAGACYAMISAAGHSDPWPQILGETILFIFVGFVTGKLAEPKAGNLPGSHFAIQGDAAQALGRTFTELRSSEMPALVRMEVGLVRQLLTPVASIQGASWVLEDPQLPEEKREEFVAIIRKESHRVFRSLSNLLDFTQPRKPRRREVNLSILLDEVIKVARPTEHGPYFLFRTDVPPDLPLLRCDPDQTKQMLLNVVMNSIEAAPGGGEIGIAAHVERDMVRIRVTDQGKGISPEALDKICEPFFTTRDNSMGLGFTIACQIAAAHGGGIAVESTSCKGTSVAIELPLGDHL